jgi:hypothetical protein
MAPARGTAGWYVRNWKAARGELAQGRRVRIAWPGHYFPEVMDAERFSRWIREALDRRINSKGGIEPTGRKWREDYQRNLRRDAREINRIGTERLRVYASHISTPEIRRRFGHLFASRDDD